MTRRSGVMLCYPFDERRLKRWSFPVLVQPKINGVRCRTVLTVYETNGILPNYIKSPILHSSEANEFVSVPHILSQVRRLDTEIPRSLLDGELYVHGMPLGDIVSITSRTVNLHPDYEKMEYHIFDIVRGLRTMWQRATAMMGIGDVIRKHELTHLRIVPTLLANTIEEIMGCMKRWVDEGYEGIIIRKYDGKYVERKSTDIMKIKKRKRLTALVYHSEEEVSIHDELKGTLGKVHCELENGVCFKVGTGFTRHERVNWWPDYLIGKKIIVEYQELTPAGKPYASSFKGLCDEARRPHKP